MILLNNIDYLFGMRQYDLIKKLLGVLNNKTEIIAVLLFGSLAKKNYTETSDIDLQVLIEDGEIGKMHFEIDNIGVDISLDNFYHIFNQSIIHHRQAYVKILGPSIIILDKTNGLTDKGLNFVRQLYASRANVHSSINDLILLKNGMENRLKEIEALMETDNYAAEYILAVTFDRLMYQFDIYNGYWLAVKRRFLEELKTKNEFFYELACSFLSATELYKKKEILEKMIKFFLEPLGGFLPKEWQTIYYGKNFVKEQAFDDNPQTDDHKNEMIDKELEKILEK